MSPICCASCATVARQLRDKSLMLRMFRDFLAHAYTRASNAMLAKLNPCATAKHKQHQGLIAQQVKQQAQQKNGRGVMASMRAAMPQVAAWIDELREAFGKDVIDHAIRTQRFVARETGPDGQVHEVRRNDTPAPRPADPYAGRNGSRKKHGGGV